MYSLYNSYKRRVIFFIMSLLVIILICMNIVVFSIFKNIIEQHYKLPGIDYQIIFSVAKHQFILLIIMFISFMVLVYFLLARVSHYFLEPMLKDKLTGAYNKRYVESLLRKEISISLKTKKEFSVLMLDLDHFKNVNDTYGHPFGDIVLAKVASLIRDCLRKDDFFIRYGGEEFIVLLFNLNPDITMRLAERIRKSIEVHEIANEDDSISTKITISIGVVILNQRNMTVSELINEVDKALYKAKETRNTVAML